MQGVRLLGTYGQALRTQQWTLETSQIPLGDPRIRIPPACLSHCRKSISTMGDAQSRLYYFTTYIISWEGDWSYSSQLLENRWGEVMDWVPHCLQSAPTPTQPNSTMSLFPQGAMLIREKSINNSTSTHWGPTVCQAERFISIFHQEVTLRWVQGKPNNVINFSI